MIYIREMTSDDLDQVTLLERRCFSNPWSKQAFEEELLNRLAIYFVVVYECNIIAYGGFWKIVEEGHITNIAVAKDFRGKGIGYQLVLALIKAGKRKGIEKFTLEVRKSNVGAIALYKKIGFNEAGIRKNYYQAPKEDALIMWY